MNQRLNLRDRLFAGIENLIFRSAAFAPLVYLILININNILILQQFADFSLFRRHQAVKIHALCSGNSGAQDLLAV